jgi:filamentous hemagglutinin family protein
MIYPTAKKTRKASLLRSSFLLALLATSFLTTWQAAEAQTVVPATTATQTYTAPNGVPIVDIATPNAAGLSHNTYNNYNVDSRGLVLNNGDFHQMARQSQLAGEVMANMNLTSEATLILNEVVSSNRSTLAGYTEVLGHAADVIVANPYGITCNGCGFINAPNATLTTGVPQISGGALTGFQIDNGDILITGDGLDGAEQNYIALLARTVKLEAQINAKELDIVAGTNDWNVTSKTATLRAPTGATPVLAIDSSALGGMYANRIRLIATEAGVGVKMLGEAASSVDDFTLTSSGKIEIGNAISAERDATITTTATGGNALRATNARISSKRNTVLTATSGELHLEGGSVTADTDLTFTASSLTDDKTVNGAYTDNNKRYGSHSLTLTNTGAAAIDGTSYGTAGNLTATTGSLGIGANGATLYTDGTLTVTSVTAMALNSAQLKSTGNLTLTSTAGAMTTTSGGAIQSTAGTVALTAATGISNAVTISSDTSSLTIRNGGTLTNSGILHAHTAVDIADATGARTQTVSNSGTILAETNLTLLGNTITNSGTIQGTQTSTLSALGQLTNSGTVILGNAASYVGTLIADVVDNLSGGTIQSAQTLNATIGTTLTNRAGGKIISTGDLSVRGLTGAAYTVNNYNVIQSGGLLSIKGNANGTAANIYGLGGSGSYLGNSIDLNTTTVSLADGSGITGNGNMTLNASTLTMTGSGSYVVASNVGHAGVATVTLTNSLSNNGVLYSGGNLTLNAPSISNNSTGGIAAYGTADLNATAGNFTNAGALYAGSLLDVSSTGTITNSASGTMNSGNDITVTAPNFTNNNDINAAHNLTMTVSNLFKNEISGGDQRAWSNNNSDTTSNTGWSSDPDWLLWGESANKYYTRTWYNYQYYLGTAPTAADKPRLLSNNQLTITGFQTATNLGGIISSPTILISSALAGATFTNDAYDLVRNNYTKTWNDHVSCCSDVIYLDYSYNLNQNTVLSSSSSTPFGAGIYTNSLTATGFGLTNIASVVAASAEATSKTGSSGTTGASGASFGGITITLPTNPNGYFVLSKNPNSSFLIETNPLYGAGSPLSSQRMIERLGINPDTVQQRLGDGNYEASLIRDQITAQTGSTILAMGESEVTQMQRLMDNGVDQGTALGLKFGTAPTAEQVAGLKQDMVWMVETVVSGHKVLAPVVYLSALTKAAIVGGAAIVGNDVHMDLASVTNTGGTIVGSKTLEIASKGDIKNTSGTIKGGDVSLTSTEGSIINETSASFSGNDENGATVIGKTAGIEATGNLNLDAKKNIANKGANMSAGGDASLKAGENITFETIEDKKAATTHSHSSGGFMDNTESSSTEGSTTNIKSGLTVTGNLKTDSGKDTTFAGANVKVGGDGDIHAGGDLKILDVQDSKSSSSTSTHSGAGVGGGVYGSETVTDDHTKKTSVGSDLSFGGKAKLSADKTLTVQGSDISAEGDLALKAKDVKILEGRNEETSSHSKTTTTLLKIEPSSGDSSSGSGSSASSGTDGDKATADSEAHADAEANGSGGVTLSSTEKTKTDSFKSTGKASNIKGGSNISIESENDTTIRGSNVEAAGDVDLKAKNISIEASKDIETTTTTNSKTSVGLYADSANKAGAHADAGAEADGGGANANAHAKANKSGAGTGGGFNAGDANAKAGAHAGAEVSSDNTLDLVRTNETSTTTTDVTHQGSSIKSGGKTTIKADNKLDVKGSDIEAGGDVDLKAKDMSFTAAEDSHTSTTTSTATKAGLYAGAKADASANADAEADSKTHNINGGVNAEANAGADVGLYGSNTTKSSSEGTTHAKTSTIKSGGNMTRNADNKITDEGTQIEAGGDFTQTSKEWESKAAKDTSFSTSSTETNTAKLGAYAEAGASAEASADTKEGTSNENEAGASAGLKASYNRTTAGDSESTSTAVTSSIKSGGKLKTTTSDKTSLEGTNLESGGDMELNAGSLDYKAAKDTATSSKNSSKIDAELKVGLDATKAVTGSISGAYDADRSTDTSSTAVVGGMKSGGNLKVNTKDDARFEGTNIEAGGDAAVKAGGNLTFDAAHDTASHTEGAENASASLSASKSKGGGAGSKAMGLEAEGGFSRGSSSSSDAVTGSIKSGGKLDLSAGKNAAFEGTALESGGDISVDAKGDVNFKAAKSTETSESYGAKASISASKGGKDDAGKAKGSSVGVEAEGSYNKADSSTSTAGSLKSGGAIKVKSGNDVTLEGTNIESAGKTSIDAAHDVNFKAAEDTSSSIGVEAGISLKKEKAAKGGDAADNKKEGNVTLGVEGGTSSTKTGGSIKAGAIDIKAGNDATLEGTALDSKTDTSLKAGRDLTLKAAESSHIEGGIKGGAGSGGASLDNASIGGGVQKDGVTIKSGGDLKLESGGDTTLEGTKAKVDGKAEIKAGGTIKKKTTVSGSGEIGTSGAGASIDVEATDIDADQGTTEKEHVNE